MLLLVSTSLTDGVASQNLRVSREMPIATTKTDFSCGQTRRQRCLRRGYLSCVPSSSSLCSYHFYSTFSYPNDFRHQRLMEDILEVRFQSHLRQGLFEDRRSLSGRYSSGHIGSQGGATPSFCETSRVATALQKHFTPLKTPKSRKDRFEFKTVELI